MNTEQPSQEQRRAVRRKHTQAINAASAEAVRADQALLEVRGEYGSMMRWWEERRWRWENQCRRSTARILEAYAEWLKHPTHANRVIRKITAAADKCNELRCHWEQRDKDEERLRAKIDKRATERATAWEAVNAACDARWADRHSFMAPESIAHIERDREKHKALTSAPTV